MQLLPGTAGTIDDYFRFVDDSVEPRIEAVPGVAGVEVNGVDARASSRSTSTCARRPTTASPIPQVAQLAAAPPTCPVASSTSAGASTRCASPGATRPQELGELILAWRDGQPVRLADVATIAIKRPERTFIGYQNGNPAIGLRIVREIRRQRAGDARRGQGRGRANCATARSRNAAWRSSRASIPGCSSTARSACCRATSSSACCWRWAACGGSCATRRATLLIASAIPISLLATFVVLQLAGRSLNVISLAGLAFAVGMVMDAAIVVAENIVRLQGRRHACRTTPPTTARARSWARCSPRPLTTIAVFLPVLFLEDVEGQLFADLAITISIAVAISMLVAVTVLPAAAGGWLKAKKLRRRRRALAGRDHALDHAPGRRPGAAQSAWVLALVAGPALLAWALLPRLDYLPPVKRAAIDVCLQLAAGHESGDRQPRDRSASCASAWSRT